MLNPLPLIANPARGSAPRRAAISGTSAVLATEPPAALRDDTQRVITAMRETHALCDEHNDVATASLLENYIDAAEKRVWFLYEIGRKGSPDGH